MVLKRSAGIGLGLNETEIPAADTGGGMKGLVGLAGNDIDRTANGVAAVKRTLRSAQDLDPFHIQIIEELRRRSGDINTIDLRCDVWICPIIDIAVADAADIDQWADPDLGNIEIWHERHQVFDIQNP